MSKNSEAVIKWRSRTKTKMRQAMGSCCQICGYDACDEAMEFHHLDPNQKDYSFGKIRSWPHKLSIIVDELKKCILLCCRCHREVHYGKAIIPETFAVLDESLLVSENELRRRMKQHTSVPLSKPPPKYNRKILLSDEQFKSILEQEFKGNKSKMAAHLNVSEAAIRKRLKAVHRDHRSRAF